MFLNSHISTYRAEQFLTGIIILGIIVVYGCTDNSSADSPGHQVEQVVISPNSASFAVGEGMDFSAHALTASGDTVDLSDLNIEWEWWSTDPDVFTVESGGAATGQSPGEEYCIVELTILQGQSNFNGRDSAFVVIF